MSHRSQDLVFAMFVLRTKVSYHQEMCFLFVLLLGVTAHATNTIEIVRETPVYQSTAPGARVLFHLRPGEKVSSAPAKNQDFLRIRAKRRGKWAAGYIEKFDGFDLDGDAKRPRGGERDWGFGGGFEYTSYTQKGKSFETEDQVMYTTTEYKSASVAPLLTVQMYQTDFWRLSVAYRKTHYTSSASTNVVGTTAKSVDLQQTFLSALLQKAWMPFQQKYFYFGAGAEAAKAISVDLQLGRDTLETKSEDMPLYLGGMIFAGGTVSLNPTLSIYGEARFEYIANQSPGIMGLQAAAGLLYWP